MAKLTNSFTKTIQVNKNGEITKNPYEFLYQQKLDTPITSSNKYLVPNNGDSWYIDYSTSRKLKIASYHFCHYSQNDKNNVVFNEYLEAFNDGWVPSYRDSNDNTKLSGYEKGIYYYDRQTSDYENVSYKDYSYIVNINTKIVSNNGCTVDINYQGNYYYMGIFKTYIGKNKKITSSSRLPVIFSGENGEIGGFRAIAFRYCFSGNQEDTNIIKNLITNISYGTYAERDDGESGFFTKATFTWSPTEDIIADENGYIYLYIINGYSGKTNNAYHINSRGDNFSYITGFDTTVDLADGTIVDAGYTITLKYPNGTIIDTKTTNSNNQATMPSLPTKYDSKTFTIAYNANGGTNTPVSQSGNYWQTINTSKSWNTSSDGSGTTYAPGTTYTFSNDTVLYAVSTGNYVSDSITVAQSITRNSSTTSVGTLQFDSKDGSSINSVSITKTTSYSFNYWKGSNNNNYQPNTAYNNFTSSSITLTAQWNTTSVYNSINLSNKIPTRDGYEFVGWSTSDGGQIVPNNFTPTSDNMTLYAIWKPKGIARIYTSEGWKTVQVYVYHINTGSNDPVSTGWHQVIPYVFKDGSWHLTQ